MVDVVVVVVVVVVFGIVVVFIVVDVSSRRGNNITLELGKCIIRSGLLILRYLLKYLCPILLPFSQKLGLPSTLQNSSSSQSAGIEQYANVEK